MAKRKKWSDAQKLAFDRLAAFLTDDFEKRCTLLRSGDRMAIQWHQMRLAYKVIGKMSLAVTREHLEQFLYRST